MKQCAVGSSYPRAGVTRLSGSALAHSCNGSCRSGGSTRSPVLRREEGALLRAQLRSSRRGRPIRTLQIRLAVGQPRDRPPPPAPCAVRLPRLPPPSGYRRNMAPIAPGYQVFGSRWNVPFASSASDGTDTRRCGPHPSHGDRHPHLPRAREHLRVVDGDFVWIVLTSISE